MKHVERRGRIRTDRGSFRKGLITLLILGMGVLLMGGFVSPGEAETWYVKENGTGDGTGGWGTASGNLGEVLKNAVSGDQIWVARGTYEPTLDTDYAVPGSMEFTTFALKSGVSLYGGFAGDETQLDQRDPQANPTTLTGDNMSSYPKRNSYHVVTAFGQEGTSITAPMRLDGFIVTGGNADGAGANGANGMGGGMYTRLTHKHLAVANCTFTHNAAEKGGGLHNTWGSNPTITNCTFTRNAAERGGGIYNDGSSPTVTDCTFSRNNAANSGGGMYNHSSSPTVTDCTFSENTAQDGGGMFNYSKPTTITNCTFSRNTITGNGGGVYNYLSNSTITNCTFFQDTAHNGGGVYNSQSNSIVTNCTFSGNHSAVEGRGMYNYNVSNPTVTNCIFWNSPGSEIYNRNGSVPVVSYCVVKNGYTAGTEIRDTDPCLENLGDNGGPTQTCLLGDKSSARNAGTESEIVGGTNVVPAKDQRGRTRPEGDAVDMGAVEMGTFLIRASAGTGGSISPSGEIIVSSGASRKFTLTPEAGYEIADLKVDGTSRGALSSYTFTNITKDHTIAGEFGKKPAPGPSPSPSVSPSPEPTVSPVPSGSPIPTATPAPQGPVIYEPWPGPGQSLFSLVPGTSEKELAKQLEDSQSPEYKELLEKLRKLLASKGLTLDPANFHLATERLYSLEGTDNPLKVILQISSPDPEEGEGYLLFVLIRTYDTESSPRKFLGYEPILLSPLSDATSPVAASEEARLYGYNVYDGTSLDELPQEGHIQVTYLEAWGKGGISEIAPSPDPSGDDGGCSLELPSLGGILLMLPPLLLLRGKRK